jgi:hypothetical protein
MSSRAGNPASIPAISNQKPYPEHPLLSPSPYLKAEDLAGARGALAVELVTSAIDPVGALVIVNGLGVSVGAGLVDIDAADGVEAVISDAVSPGLRAGGQEEGGRSDEGGELHLDGGGSGSWRRD